MKLSAFFLSLLIALASAKPIGLQARQGGSPKDTAISFLRPAGVPEAMLNLIKAGPDALIQQIMGSGPEQLQNTINSLKAGKIPTIPGTTPKNLMLQFLPGLGVPAPMIELVKATPDAIMGRTAQLPVTQLQPIIDQLKQGQIPTIPGVTAKQLIVASLPGLGVPAATVSMIGGLPDATMAQIATLKGPQLQTVISQLKAGQIPQIPGIAGPGAAPAGPAAGPAAVAPVAPGAAPAAAVPAGAVPAGAVPAGAAPAGAAPAGAVPAGAVPAGAVPAGAAPVGVAPAGVAPAGAAPAGAVPAGAAPAGAAPAGPAPVAPAAMAPAAGAKTA
ncbi:hypothetical protein AA313_de0203917 [Arthrobotrys entomopaga]|nr:hypothetical protein AA313_de0203917 [Arthrobotrys entomopaga]